MMLEVLPAVIARRVATEAIHPSGSSFWIASSRSLSSGAHARDPHQNSGVIPRCAIAHLRMRHPNSGLPEFGNIIVQVGNSRLGCAGPESIPPVVVMDSGLARSLSSGRAMRGPVGAPRNDGWT